MENNSKKAPFFIVGCPRSGTTLLQLLIDSHPNIAIPPESHIFVRFSRLFDHYGDLRIESNLKLFVKDLLNDYHIKDWNLGVSVDEFCNQLEEVSLHGVISHVLELYAKKEGKKRWGDKTPQHALYLDKIKEVFKEARFLHLIRDGRDVAESSHRIFVGPPSIYGIAHEWRRYILTFNEFKKTLGQEEFLELHYENLVRNPEGEVNRIFNFLDEDPLTINHNIPNTTAKQYYLQTDLHMLSLNSPISDKKVGSFKNIFTQRQIEIFEFIARDALELCGYPLTTTGSTTVKLTEKIDFLIKDKFYRYYRKYLRPTELNKAWILFRREVQYHKRTLIRSRRKEGRQNNP